MSSINYIKIKCGSRCENCDFREGSAIWHEFLYLDDLQHLEEALSILESEIHKTLLIGFHHVLTQTFFDVSSFKSKLPKDVSLLLVGTPTDRQKMQELRDIGRLFLHSRELTILLPSGEQKTFVAPLPDDLNKVLEELPKV